MAVHRILTKPFYIGKIQKARGSEGYIDSNCHKTIIPEDLFFSVQERFKSKRVSMKYAKKIPYPYRGLIRCYGYRRIYTLL